MRVQIPSGALKTVLSEEAYEPHVLEQRWQDLWREEGAHRTPRPDDRRPPYYVFITPPFTSGDAHLGHARSYTIGDSYARFKRMSGTAVLFSVGFDAFGLPAELSAAERQIPPADWVAQCRVRMKRQFDRLGLSFDWSRSFASSEPSIYRWTQLIFLLLLERDLVYQSEVDVDWCPGCQTVLANSQIEGGLCWRCDRPAERRRKLQWFLRLSAYNAENYQRLENLAWSGPALGAQRTVLGRVDGVELDGFWPDGTKLTLFSPHDQPVEAAELVLLSPLHPHAAMVERRSAGDAEELFSLRRPRDRGARKATSDVAIGTGLKVTVPALGRDLPAAISASVDSRAGPTALLGAPALNAADRAIATRLGLDADDGLREPPRGAAEIRPALRFRARDFPISRQRAWGTPIPIVHCPDCGVVPVGVDELPVRLPENIAAGDRLADFPGFLACDCPDCGEPARRETDTLDCHIDAAWAPVPLAVPSEERDEAMFSSEELKRWMPVDRLVMGSDTGSFMLDMRMATKALRDAGQLGFIETGEPYTAALMHGMVLLSDQKMSKHLKNVVSPDSLIEEYGADTLRLTLLYAARPERDLAWNEDTKRALAQCANFLRRLNTFAARAFEAYQPVPDDGEGEDRQLSELSDSCARALDRVTESLESLAMHRACRAAMDLLEELMEMGRRHERGDSPLDAAALGSLKRVLFFALQLLAPFAPHLCEELWRRGGRVTFVSLEPWPRETPV